MWLSLISAVSSWAAEQRWGPASREQLISAFVQKKTCACMFEISTGWRALQWAAWAVHGRGTSVASCIWPLIKENNAFFLIIHLEDSPWQLCEGNETGGGGGVKQLHTAEYTLFPGRWFSVRIFFFFFLKHVKANVRSSFLLFSTSRCRDVGFKNVACKTWMKPVDL